MFRFRFNIRGKEKDYYRFTLLGDITGTKKEE